MRTLLLSILLLCPATAAADLGDELDLGLQVYGMVTGSFLSELDDQQKVRDGNRLTLYPGFGGVGGGGGLNFEAMWRGIVGVQVGFAYSVDSVSGDLVQGAREVTANITQSAIHIPFVLKVAAPIEVVRPFGFVGGEYVVPGEPEVSQSGGTVAGVAAKADPYLALAFGAGMEFMLPIPEVDLRIPLTLRGRLQPRGGRQHRRPRRHRRLRRGRLRLRHRVGVAGRGGPGHRLLLPVGATTRPSAVSGRAARRWR